MAVLSAFNLNKNFGENELFHSGTFEIGEHEAVGLIGANGVGKTTLFKMITGEDDSFGGEIVKGKNTVIGYMEQHACASSQLTLFGELLTVFSHLEDMERELQRLMTDIDSGEGDIDELILRQSQLTEKYNDEGGLTYKSRARATLIGLGFSEDDFYIPVRNLSGGQKSKLSLGKLLLSQANLLLLDEPTNHLDIESVEWLEDFLREYKGSLIIISHDRYFLDRVTNKTIELEHKKLTVHKGNYSEFMKQKEHEKETVRRNYENTMAEVHRIEGIIAQQKQWNRERNIKTAESKQKMIDRLLDGLEKPDEESKEIKFNFNPEDISGNDVLFCDNLSKSFGSKRLFHGVDLKIYKGDRMFLLGPNGCGKTTLLRILTGEEFADTGEYRFGAKVKIGYFNQNLQGLDSTETALDEIWNEHKDFTMTEVRNALAVFLFRGDDVYKRMCDLSGGEKAKIALLKLMLKGANVLLLDEPTNHLDIMSRESLENALLSYGGTMLVVSHDRYFINKLATKTVRFDGKGVEYIDGNYDTYCEKLLRKKDIVKTEKAVKPAVNDYKLRKERESEIRKLKTKISKNENAVSETENKIEEINNQLQIPEISSDYEKVTELTKELDELKILQENLLTEWEELSEKLESMTTSD